MSTTCSFCILTNIALLKTAIFSFTYFPYKIISTGGTFEELKKNGIEVIPIEEITGNPRDCFDGRMKTISFQIESGILFAKSGISGNEENGMSSYHILADALRDGYRIIVITGEDLQKIKNTSDLIKLIEGKIGKLIISVKVN